MQTISEALKFYRKATQQSLCDSLERSAGVASRSQVYNASVTIWLMIFQRLNPDHSLSAAVDKLRAGHFNELLDRGSLKAQSRKISGATGAYSSARERLERKVLEDTIDDLNAAVIACHRKQEHKGRRVFVVDGSTLRIPHTEKNLSAYPPNRNQHGESHFPLVRFSVMTDAVTGVALRPAYGPYVGGKATNELDLLEELLPLLPTNSVVIGDRLYGCPRVADEVQEHGHDVICRLKSRTVKKLVGTISSSCGEKEVTWESSRSNKGNCYETEGRVVWYTLRRKGYRPQQLFLFTTLPFTVKDIAELYALRWNVELDLRQIKSTLDMNSLNAKSPEMVKKELITGMAAYNLICHVMFVSAKILKLTPRELSFTQVLRRVRIIFEATLTMGENSALADSAFSTLLADVNSMKLPKRKKTRPPEPRKVWVKNRNSRMTSSREQERAKLLRK